jgi:magnesium transporter
MRTFVLSDGLILETSDWAEARAARERGEVIWVDLDAEPSEAANQFLTWLGIHDLTIEDIWHERLFPKLEDFDTYLVVLVHGVHREHRRDGELAVVEIEIVLGQGFVVTHAHGDSRSIAAVREEVLRTGRCLKKGPVWVLHGVLDHLVDHYTPLLDQYDEELDQLEHDIVAKAGTPQGRGLLPRIFTVKRELQQLRRIAAHQREILLRLARAEFDEIPAETTPFFRDVYDHFVRVTDLAEGYRELVTSAMEAYLSVQSNRMNEVMKTLTLISTVMLPLTFIAGVYGMNFESMPELRWKYGYPAALGMMALVTGGILAFFRKRRWL